MHHHTCNITTTSKKHDFDRKRSWGKEHVDLLPSRIHPTLRPSINNRLAFIHLLYLHSTAFAAVLYALQHALWTAPNMPWAPTMVPIECDPSDQEVPWGGWASTAPCYPQRIRGRQSCRLVVARDPTRGERGSQGGCEGCPQAGREGVPRGVRAPPAAFRDSGARCEGMLGHRRNWWMRSGNTIPTGAPSLGIDTLALPKLSIDEAQRKRIKPLTAVDKLGVPGSYMFGLVSYISIKASVSTSGFAKFLFSPLPLFLLLSFPLTFIGRSGVTNIALPLGEGGSKGAN